MADESGLAEVYNALYDLSLATRDRLGSAAALANSPEVKGHLTLAAAEHDVACDRLMELVRRVRGTPHDGDTQAASGRSTLPRPIGSRRNDRELLASCAGEEAALIERLDAALQLQAVDESSRSVLQDCRAAAERRKAGFTSSMEAMR